MMGLFPRLLRQLGLVRKIETVETWVWSDRLGVWINAKTLEQKPKLDGRTGEDYMTDLTGEGKE